MHHFPSGVFSGGNLFSTFFFEGGDESLKFQNDSQQKVHYTGRASMVKKSHLAPENFEKNNYFPFFI